MKNLMQGLEGKILIYDGSKGSLLQKAGMTGGECPELWNVEKKDEVIKIYRQYKDAGSNVIQTNTFQGNRISLEKYGLGDRVYELNFEGAKLAREVMGDDGYVAASVGPIGKLFEPSGDLTFQLAYDVFAEQVKALVEGGVDLINFETFTDLAEMRAALIAAKEVCDIPVACSLAFEANGKTLMGTDPFIAALVLKSLGADIVGTNCSFGPEQMVEIIKKMNKIEGIQLVAKPNAGLPEMINGVPVFTETPEHFASLAQEFAHNGVQLIGGCCGTNPQFISEIKLALENTEVAEIDCKSKKNDYKSVLTSLTKQIEVQSFDNLNVGYLDTRKDMELLKELGNGNLEYVVDAALDISVEGDDAVIVFVDESLGDESLLSNVVNIAQGYIKEPFIIEVVNNRSLETALRVYKGRAGVFINRDGVEDIEKLTNTAHKYGSVIL